MDHDSVNNLKKIKNEVYLKKKNCEVIAVSKTFDLEKIKPLIDHGHRHYGENKVQEAIDKWSDIKVEVNDIKLHLIGKLQSNKVKHAVKIFDYIHSLDSLKLAKKIHEEQIKIKKKLKVFIQINLENEKQKGGINPSELEELYNYSTKSLDLNIIGLMCIPPINLDPKDAFNSMRNLNKKIGFKDLSIGMSSDYLDAVDLDATFIRVGSKIFGKRN
tara:strand:+ start:441 stop:1088 length:648 start_codon:yes stop_codon:yes gene_type:complete